MLVPFPTTTGLMITSPVVPCAHDMEAFHFSHIRNSIFYSTGIVAHVCAAISAFMHNGISAERNESANIINRSTVLLSSHRQFGKRRGSVIRYDDMIRRAFCMKNMCFIHEVSHSAPEICHRLKRPLPFRQIRLRIPFLALLIPGSPHCEHVLR